MCKRPAHYKYPTSNNYWTCVINLYVNVENITGSKVCVFIEMK